MEICTREALPADVAAFRAIHVYAFLKGVADRGVSLGTRHRRYRETRAFFSWCMRMELCAQNPFAGIPNVKVEQKIVQPLTEAEIGALLAICEAGSEFGCRNRAIILLFLDTGMRYTELHRLALADLAWDARRIHIRHGKGRKQARRALRRRAGGGAAGLSGPVPGLGVGSALPDRGSSAAAAGPMNPSLLGTLFTRLGQRAGVHANPHRFRHTFATWAIENHARELDVQYLLGAFHVGDGAPLLRHLRRGQGRGRPCGLQSRGRTGTQRLPNRAIAAGISAEHGSPVPTDPRAS